MKSGRWKTVLAATGCSILGALTATALILTIVIDTGMMTVTWGKDNQSVVVETQEIAGISKTETQKEKEAAPSVPTEPELLLYGEEPAYQYRSERVERAKTRDGLVYSNAVQLGHDGYIEYDVNGYKTLTGTLTFTSQYGEVTPNKLEIRIIGDGDKELCSPITIDESNPTKDIRAEVSGNDTVRIECRKIVKNGWDVGIYIKDLKLSID